MRCTLFIKANCAIIYKESVLYWIKQIYRALYHIFEIHDKTIKEGIFMKNAFSRKATAVILAALLSAAAAGCAQQAAGPEAATAQPAVTTPEASPQPPQEVIEITYPTFRVGAHNAAAAETEYLKQFEEKFGDRIKVVVEALPSDQAYYDKMKILAASSELPDVVEGNFGVLEAAIKNGQVIDLQSYVDADAQYKSEIGEEALKANTIDGKLYSISNGMQMVGYFYNKEIFEKAGIQPAKTWPEFMENCEKLKSAGFVPLSLMTGENCWTTNLILASIIGTSGEEGNKFMNTKYPETYQKPFVNDAFTMVQKMLKDYTTEDALGAIYANAANHFLTGKTAIIANGPWMTPDFSNTEKAPEGFDKKVGVAIFPEGGVISQFERGFSICAKTKEKQDAAFEFIRFKTNANGQKIHLELAGVLPLTSNIEFSEEFKQKNPLVVDLVKLSDQVKYRYQSVGATCYPSVDDAISKLYPELVSGKLSPADMTRKLDEAAAKNK